MNGVSAVVSDWLRQASLDKYVANFHGVTEEAFLNLLMQDYGKHGVDSTDDKQKLFRLIKRLNAEMKANARQASEWAPPGAEAHARNHHFQDQSPIEGLLDLEEHDGELLMHANSGEDLAPNQARTAQRVGTPSRPLAPALDLDMPDPPKIRVVVRKRPLNRKEIERGDDCILETDMSRACVIVNETKVKVDLTKYVERHRFNFDDALDESVDNDMVYRATVQPLVHTIFNYGKSTCFAYGQTGSGKTYTMSPLPIRAAADIFHTLQHPDAGELSLWVSCFEIYGGKCYDLLNDRKRLEVREDGRKKICVVGLKEYHVNAASAVQSLIEHSGNARMTGSTGANADSSRSHSIMQFALKRSRQNAEGLREVGRISFIDLAGSERGADTFDNDRQTRIEGAEINKSLLALKECIRALDSDARHVPFRGSKLTEVLRDSFVGSQARTVMIANVSPTASSCEHTLNTLRYADRVKELRKDKADRLPGGVTPAVDAAYNAAAQRGALGPPSKGMGMRQSVSSVTGDGNAAAAHSEISPFKEKEPAHMPSPEERRPLVQVQEDSQRQLPQQQSAGSRDLLTVRDEMIHSILEGEDELIQMHRKAIEDTMDIVRREMNLLAEVDQPGSAIDSYVEKLGLVLDEKASAIHQLRRRLEAFKAKLLEEETLSRTMTGQRTSR